MDVDADSQLEGDAVADAATQIRFDPSPSPPQTKKKKKRKPDTTAKEVEVNATIQVLSEHPEKSSPLIGYFPSGFNPHSKVGYESESEPDPSRVTVYRNKARPNRMELVVSPAGSRVDFVGTNYAGEAASGQMCSYALGVFDKEKGSLKIVPIASNKIFRLEPRVGGLDYTDKEPSNVSKGEFSAREKVERMRELTNLYGTKKSITQAKKMHALNLPEDPNSNEDLDRKIKEIKVNKDALESDNAHTVRNVPPYDSFASTPHEAYPLDKIILKGERSFLKDVIELLQEEAEIAFDAYPTFVCNRFHKLREIKDEVEKETLACIFSYLNHLIKFKDQHSMDTASSAKKHKIPNILRQKFSSMFANAQSKRLSDEKNDLLISYVLVLTLFADGFHTDPSDIAKDLRMSPVKLRMHFEHLGCKLSHQKGFLVATLPVPLQFPKVRQKRRR